MNKPQSLPTIASVATVSWLLAASMLAAPQAHGQQPAKFSSSYTSVARAALQAIESDDSTSQNPDHETLQLLAATGQHASSAQEASFAKALNQIYRLRLQDNDLLRAYGKLIEVDGAADDNDTIFTKRYKESALSQLADGEEAIMRREVGCFKQLEQSLVDRSLQDAPACSEWIHKAAAAHKNSLLQQ